MAITIAFGQLFRSLHPPAGAVALLGIISNENLNFILSPTLYRFFNIGYVGNSF